MNNWLYFFPLLSAIIGWIIHFIAGNYFSGVFLAKKKLLIAEKLGKAAALEFAAYRGLEEKINDPKNLESILPLIDRHIDVFLNERLKTEMPMIAMFIGNKTTDKLKEVFMKEIQSLFPQVISQFAGNLKSGIDLQRVIVDRVNSIPLAELKQLIRKHLSSPLGGLRWLGAITGLIIGLVGLLFMLFCQ
jgi:uncharacterized membrane protein YheB (UPF0754 family)